MRRVIQYACAQGLIERHNGEYGPDRGASPARSLALGEQKSPCVVRKQITEASRMAELLDTSLFPLIEVWALRIRGLILRRHLDYVTGVAFPPNVPFGAASGRPRRSVLATANQSISCNARATRPASGQRVVNLHQSNAHMSTSERDKDIWKMRQLSKRKNALFTYPCSAEEGTRVRGSQQYLSLQAEFDRLHAKYGFNTLIFNDNARKNSRRHAARRIETSIKRASKRAAKQQDRATVRAQLDDARNES
ncbi:hypothetical protein PQR34_47115 [Paraburkholderia sediminicola]|uniref:hypothetical protein n=1 Tax=Paraburkholderia sediminicola TaxID=458836 RepID=UPI0038BAC7F8